ncbi:hypothetical protein N8602_00135 [bacterium]|nr:hypothetical protein [bacterium]
MGIGFRDNVNYFNLDPITAGPQVTDYIDFSNFVPSYVPPPPPPAPAPVVDSGGGNNDLPSGIGNDYWNDQYQGDGGGWDNEGPGDFGGGDNYGGGPAEDTDDPMGWSDGGTIPPMYANRGNLVNDMLGIADNRKPFDTTIGLLNNAAEDLGGTINKTSENIYKGIKDYAAPYTNFTDKPSKNTFDEMLAASLTPSNMLNYTAGGPAVVGAPLIEGAFDFLNYIGKTYGDESIAKQKAYKDYVTDIVGNPIAAAEAAVGDYGIDDTLDPNIGAIPGNYAPPSSNITTVSNPITGTPVYNDFVASTYDDFMADVAAEIAAIDSEYQDFTPSYSNTDFDDDDGGGYDPGNAGHSPGSSANASDPNTGMGMGIGGGNDGFRSAGGHIYASQGGYVNSTGGK